MRRGFLLAILSVCAHLGCGRAPSAAEAEASAPSSYPSVESRWSSPEVEVCWEAAAEDYPTEQSWVRSRVVSEYENKTNVRLVGWERCSSYSEGIHVTVNDGQGSNPHTVALGRFVNATHNGMELNFTFRNWSRSCQGNRRACIESIAVHEFGHAIGLAHEQNRPDTPSTCNSPKQGSNGDTMVGQWDAYSVMNYCNPIYNNGGRLSSGDVAGVAKLYGWKR